MAQQAMASVPLRDQSNIVLVVEPPRKRGQKTVGEVLEHQHLVKALAQGLVKIASRLIWRMDVATLRHRKVCTSLWCV